MKRYGFSSNKEIDNMLNHVIRKINAFVHKQHEQIEYLTNVSLALSSERDLERFFELILEGASNLTSADGATLYMLSADKQNLEFRIVFNRSLNIRYGGRFGEVPWKHIRLHDDYGKPDLTHMVSYVYHKGESSAFEDVYKQDQFDKTGTMRYDKENGYRSQSMIAVPLKNNEDRVLGVIQLINSISSSGKVVSFSDEHFVILRALASQAAIALTNRSLLSELEQLLREFVKTIAFTLDQKSRYSGKHITRVAILTEMISKVINDSDSGIFRDVHYSVDEMGEISMSGWLHDIGKIITPEYIMDKSTKLETIFDRIDMIALRFDLVKQIVGKKALNLGRSKVDNEQRGILDKLFRQLDDDLNFLRDINIGGESLDDVSIMRLESIKNFKIDDDDREYRLITEEEFQHLSVRRGTLTPQELQLMKEHALVTKKILSQLTFPRKFSNIPLYASSHHEKLNGSGYPDGLEEGQLPLPARIIAIADIFEALTAADRPYRVGNRLSEALTIMAKMVKSGEIDRDIFFIILDSGLYLEYAREYFNPAQIDDVNIDFLKRIVSE